MSKDDPVEQLLVATGFYYSGQLGKALELIDGALQEASAQQSDALEGIMIQKAGWLRESGRVDEALALVSAAEQRLHRAQRQVGAHEWASLRLEQANLARLRGDFSRAESLLAEAAAFGGDSPAADVLLPDVYANQAAVYLNLARLGDAQDVLFKALAIDRRVGNTRNVANDLNMLGSVYEQLGDADTARAYYNDSFEVASKNGHAKEAADALSNLAILVDNRGEPAKAADMFATVDRFYVDMRYGSDAVCAVSNQGITALRLHDHARGRELLTKAHRLHLEVGNQAHAIYDQINLSQLEEESGDRDRALRLALDGLTSARQHGMVDLQWKLELLVAELRVASAAAAGKGDGDSDKPGPELLQPITAALEGLRRAADIIELLRTQVDRPEEREWFLVDKERIYEVAVGLCAGLGKAKELFGWCERGRARAFLDAVGPDRLNHLEPDSPRIRRRSELVARLLDREVDPQEKSELFDELRVLRTEIVAEQPAVSAVTDAELPRFEDVCAAIPEGTCVLEYFQVGDNAVFHLLFDRDGLRAAGMTPFNEPVEAAVARFRQELDGSDADLAAGRLLLAGLFGPVWSELAGTTRLIVVPHRTLHAVPWSALWYEPDADGAPTRQYLRNQFLLATVPSASYLQQHLRAAPAGQRGEARIVLGDPTGDLEGAAEEARQVASKLGVQPLLGLAATRAALLDAPPSALLHLAGHGTYNPDDPLLSALHMADGAATVEDMLSHGPRTGILVLSGCVTGLSGRRPGDELVGLARAALLSGTRSIVVTLWETADEASRSFFRHFYDSLTEGATVSDAIAWAQEQLATGDEGYDHPVDWAPFLLIGDLDQRLVEPDETPMAVFNQGAQLLEQGDDEGAKAAFQRAIDSGSPAAAARGAFALGTLLNSQGDPERALAAWRQAADGGDPAVVPMALYGVGGLLEQQGDLEGARAAYQRAIHSNHPKAAPKAANNLGILLAGQGDLEGARAAYQRAIDSNHHEAAPMAANNLGVLLEQQGDVEGALAAFQRAAQSDDADVARHAAASIADLRRRRPRKLWAPAQQQGETRRRWDLSRWLASKRRGSRGTPPGGSSR